MHGDHQPEPEGQTCEQTPEELAELREHYDTTSTADQMTAEAGRWETDIDPDPMVTTSLRIPKSLLDWVRERAADERVRPSALIRRWIEDHRDGGVAAAAEVTARLERLEHAVFDQAG